MADKLNLENIDLGSFGINQEQQTQKQLNANMSEAVKVNPDQHNEVLKTSEASGVPAFAVKTDPTSVQNKLKLDQIDLDGMAERAPATSNFLTSDVNNAVIAQEDVMDHLLEDIEETFRGMGRSIGIGFDIQTRGLLLAGNEATSSRVDDIIPASAMPLGMEMEAMRLSREFASNLGIETDEQLAEAKQEATDRLVGEIQSLQAERKALTPEDLSIVQEGIRAGVESLANMAPGIGLTLLSGGRAAPLLVTAGAQTYAASYGEGRAEGLTPEEAQWFATIDAAIEVGTEILPTGTIERVLTGKSTGLKKDALKFVVQEMGTEQLATALQTINSFMFGLDEELENAQSAQEIIDIQLRRQAVTAIATIVAGGTQITAASAVNKTVAKLTQKEQDLQNQGDTEQKNLDTLNDRAEKSKLRERNVEAFKQFVREADGENNTSVFIDGVQTALYLQSKTREEIESDPALKALDNAVSESRTTGADVAVPVDEFMGDIAGTEHYNQLREHMTMSDQTVSPFRQEQHQAETQAYVTALMDEAQENASEYVEAQEIYTQVRDQLIDTGMVNDANASTMAQVVPAWATAQARRTGRTVQEVYESAGLTIEGPQTGERARLEGEQVLTQFAGIRAETASLESLQEAKNLQEKGDTTNEAIRRRTGWFKGVDDRWRFEISDDEATIGLQLDSVPSGMTVELSEVLDHSKLFAAYPDLADLKVTLDPDLEFLGSYHPSNDTISLQTGRSEENTLSTLLHEVQHAIQERENFARGGSPDEEFTGFIKASLKRVEDREVSRLEDWEWLNKWKIDEAAEASDTAQQGLLYKSMTKLMEYANHERPSSVFRLIRNEVQWIYSDRFRDDNGRALDDRVLEIERSFYGIPKRGPKRNEAIGDIAFKTAQLLRDHIDPDKLRTFREDERTLNGMLKALEREASRKRKELEPQREIKERKRAATTLRERTKFKTPYQIYRALAGEIEARTTQARQALTEEERQARPVTADMDVPPEEAIIVVGGLEIMAPTSMSAATEGEQVFRQEQPTAGEARGYYDPSNSIIRLTESSDLSTFLHEFAHFMYEMEVQSGSELNQNINNWYKRNGEEVAAEATRYINGDFDAIKQGERVSDAKVTVTADDVTAYLDNGTTGDIDKDNAVRRATHEQFARGFETYLMEGKSPSIELRNAFRTFARWLAQIYQAFRGDLNINLDNEMRQVFDRLLATEEQIAAAESRARVEPMFTDAAMAGMTEEEFADYQKRQEKVKDVQTETLRDQMMKALTRKTKQWWKEEKADLVDEETDRLSSERPYVARTRLKDGDIKLDHATVKEMIGEQRTDKLGRTSTRVPDTLRGMTAKGMQGIHPDEAAALLGYNSGSELLNDLTTTPPIKEAAEANAESRMVDRHGDPFTDGTIERLADEAVQNEERGKLILHELKMLARGTNQRAIDRQTMKSLAEERIGNLSFREIHPGKYRKAEIRAAQDAARMLAEGNREGAAQAKTRQALNYYLGMAATEAKNETTKIVDRMSRYNKKKVREEIQKAEGGYWDQIVKILERFEFRKSATLAQVDQVNQDINTWARERMDVDGDGLVLHNAVLNESYVTHWKNVAYRDLQGINDSVKNIEHVARYANKLTRMGEEIEFNKLVDRWVTSIDEKVATRFKSKRTDIVEGRNWGRWLMAQMTKIPFMASWLDGGERVGLSHQVLVQPFTDAYQAELKLWETAGKPVMDAIENRSKEDIKRHNRKIYIPEIEDHLFGHQILAVALNTGNEGNLRKLLLGERWANPDNPDEITLDNQKLQAVLSHMTESDWNMVQMIWDQMETLYPQLAEVHRRTTGLVPPKVEATPVSTEFGTFRGGYYPVKYDPNRSARAAQNEDRLNAETESMFSNNSSIQASVNTGSTNERTGFYGAIRLSLDVVPAHFQEAIHYITHHDPVREVNRLIRDSRVTQAIKEKLGPEEYAQLKPWLNDIAKDGREAPTKMFWDDILQRLRFGVTLGAMGFKASTGIIQISGLSNTISEVGLANTMQGMRSVLGSTTTMREAWNFAVENSKVLEHRAQTMDREIKNAMKRIEGKRGVLAAVQEASMKHIALIQTYMVDTPSWHAAYIKGMKEWGDETRAFQYADFVIENVQGSGVTKDLARIMRGQSETGRMFTMFMTFFSSLWNMERDLVKGARSGRYSPTNLAAKVMFLFTIPVLFEMLMRGELTDEDQSEEELLQTMLTKTALYPVQSVPFMRDIANAVAGDFGYNISPMQAIIEQGTQTIPAVVERGFTDEEITKGQAKGATKFIGAAAGIPGTSQAWATGEHLYDVVVDGEELTMHQLLFGPKREK